MTSRRQVIRIIEQLEAMGVVERIEQEALDQAVNDIVIAYIERNTNYIKHAWESYEQVVGAVRLDFRDRN